MDKKDIVVGGIYEIQCASCEKVDIAHVVGFIVDDDSQVECLVQLPSNHEYLSSRLLTKIHLRDFIKQVGYDATFTVEYKQIQDRIKTIQGYIDACNTLLGDKNKYYRYSTSHERLEQWKRHYTQDIEDLTEDLESIKATSWFKDGDNA